MAGRYATCGLCPECRRLRFLNDRERMLLSPYVAAEDLEAAILHDGHVPWYLSRRFVAIVRGRNVYLRAGAYDAHTAEGLALLAHELTHVRQYREGMTVLRYLWCSLRGYLKNPYEIEAFAVQARVRAGWSNVEVAAEAPINRDLQSSK